MQFSRPNLVNRNYILNAGPVKYWAWPTDIARFPIHRCRLERIPQNKIKTKTLFESCYEVNGFYIDGFSVTFLPGSVRLVQWQLTVTVRLLPTRKSGKLTYGSSVFKKSKNKKKALVVLWTRNKVWSEKVDNAHYRESFSVQNKNYYRNRFVERVTRILFPLENTFYRNNWRASNSQFCYFGVHNNVLKTWRARLNFTRECKLSGIFLSYKPCSDSTEHNENDNDKKTSKSVEPFSSGVLTYRHRLISIHSKIRS